MGFRGYQKHPSDLVGIVSVVLPHRAFILRLMCSVIVGNRFKGQGCLRRIYTLYAGSLYALIGQCEAVHGDIHRSPEFIPRFPYITQGRLRSKLLLIVEVILLVVHKLF